MNDVMAERSSPDTQPAYPQVPGLQKGLDILAQFSPAKPVLGAPELSRRLGIARTTLYRLLHTLESMGFLERAGQDRRFRLGLGVLRLGFQYLNSLGLTEYGIPVIQRLRDATGCTCYIAVRDGADAVCVARANSAALPFNAVNLHAGMRFPVQTTACGDVLMGDMSRAQLDTFCRGVAPGAIDMLDTRVRAAAAQGYGDRQSPEGRGMRTISAAVRDETGHTVAAIAAISLPRENRQPADDDRLIGQIRQAAAELSDCLNYRR